MLDCSRNAVMKPESLKKFIDITSKMGYNMIQLYTEDTFEVDGEPYFGYMRGRYSKEELKEIDAYAQTKSIELVPCVQTLAHFNAIVRWYGDIVDCNDILLVEEERTYQLIENIFKTLSECFTSRRVNIGMDEAHMVGLGKYLDKHGYKNRFEILSEHLKKVCSIATKYGYKPAMWSDMFFRLATNGGYYTENEELLKPVVPLVPEEVELIYWDYYSTEKTHYDNMMKAHKVFNNNLWFAGGCWSWRGFYPNNSFSFKAIDASVESCLEYGIKNVFFTMWKDNGGECSFFSLLPSLMYAACKAQGIIEMSVIKSRFFEITGIAWDDMVKLDLPNDVGPNPLTTQNPSKYMLYNDLFMGMFDLTVHPDNKQHYDKYIPELKALSSNPEYGYIFESAYKHCEVLKIKFDLGLKTREYYQNKDIKALKVLSGEYQQLYNKVKDFYYAFRTLWEKENKAHGFDVQDLRLGGLLMRIENCKRRLDEFVSGKLDRIEELEEKLLPFKNETNNSNTIIFNNWTHSVTPNNI